MSDLTSGDPPTNALRLEIAARDGQIVRHELIAGAKIIGRLADCDIQLDSPRVSRQHAELFPEAGGWHLRDLASRNGTRVNGQAVLEHSLAAGDVIHIGEFELRVVSAAEEGHTTLWSADDPDAAAFTRLGSSPAPRLNASHLAGINALSGRLMEIPDARQRMIELCRTLVGAEMNCTSAVVLRISLAAMEQPPQILCPFQLRGSMPAAPGISRAVVEAAVRDQQPILAGGVVASGLTVSFSESERGVTAIIACPLRCDATAADVLYATLPHDRGTVDWLALVTLAVEQLKKAELQIAARQNTQANAALQHDLKKARKIQMSLAPNNPAARGLEIGIGFEPSLWVGGDYVNVLATPDGRVLLAVADASGKGLPAAMVATGVHSIVHASVTAGAGLAEMAQSLNRFLLESMDRQSFVTMLAVWFDPETGNAQCLNAGHPPMLIAERNGKIHEMPYGHNPPLGVMPMMAEIDLAELKPGQLLLLYTDGLSEMMDSGGKMIGVEGVKSRIAALYLADPDAPLSELSARLKAEMEAIGAGRPAADDRTFLLARGRPLGE